MHKDVHHVFIDFLSDSTFRSPWKQHKFNAEQGNQNEGSSYCFHVQVGFCLVGVFQLGYEYTDNI